MRKANCPLCGESCVVIVDNDQFGLCTQTVLQWHTAASGSEAGIISMSMGTGRRDLDVNPVPCLGWGLTPAFAEGVAADIRGGIQLRAHP